MCISYCSSSQTLIVERRRESSELKADIEDCLKPLFHQKFSSAVKMDWMLQEAVSAQEIPETIIESEGWKGS